MQTQKGANVTVKEETQSTKSLKELVPAQKLHGKISKIELFGAFVDVGLEQHGLIHISQLKRGQINRVEDIVKQGDEIDVWVLRVDPNADRLDLTLIKPLALKWKDIRPGNKYSGEVIRLENFGAFVDIGIKESTLVHISQIKDAYVSNPADVLILNQHVNVKIISVDTARKRIQLSMKGIEQ